MRVIKLTISYDGTNFFGWQRQSKLRSVQGEIEKVLTKIVKSPVEIDGAGRTDAGVHAIGQTATFGMESTIPLENLKRAMNNFLPSDVYISNVEEMPPDFHARYSAIGKTYVYQINHRKARDVFKANYSYCYPYDLDDEKIKQAMKYLIGEHDFSSFKATGSSAGNPVRTIHDITLKREGQSLTFTFTGNGFLYKMVRILTAFLLEVGQGHYAPEMTLDLLKNPSRKNTAKVAPAQGLYLKEVYYEKA